MASSCFVPERKFRALLRKMQNYVISMFLYHFLCFLVRSFAQRFKYNSISKSLTASLFLFKKLENKLITVFRNISGSITFHGVEYNILKAISKQLNFSFDMIYFPTTVAGTKSDMLSQVRKFYYYDAFFITI